METEMIEKPESGIVSIDMLASMEDHVDMDTAYPYWKIGTGKGDGEPADADGKFWNSDTGETAESLKVVIVGITSSRICYENPWKPGIDEPAICGSKDGYTPHQDYYGEGEPCHPVCREERGRGRWEYVCPEASWKNGKQQCKEAKSLVCVSLDGDLYFITVRGLSLNKNLPLNDGKCSLFQYKAKVRQTTRGQIFFFHTEITAKKASGKNGDGYAARFANPTEIDQAILDKIGAEIVVANDLCRQYAG